MLQCFPRRASTRGDVPDAAARVVAPTRERSDYSQIGGVEAGIERDFQGVAPTLNDAD